MSESMPRVGVSRTRHISGLSASVRRALELCQERNARDAILLDLRGLSDATDFFLIASGNSDVHVRAISDHIMNGLAAEGLRPAGVEGQR